MLIYRNMVYVFIGFIIILSFIIFPISTFLALILVYSKATSLLFSIIFITFLIDLYRLNKILGKKLKIGDYDEKFIKKIAVITAIKNRNK